MREPNAAADLARMKANINAGRDRLVAEKKAALARGEEWRLGVDPFPQQLHSSASLRPCTLDALLKVDTSASWLLLSFDRSGIAITLNNVAPACFVNIRRDTVGPRKPS